jgi:hypothetical protein
MIWTLMVTMHASGVRTSVLCENDLLVSYHGGTDQCGMYLYWRMMVTSAVPGVSLLADDCDQCGKIPGLADDYG